MGSSGLERVYVCFGVRFRLIGFGTVGFEVFALGV